MWEVQFKKGWYDIAESAQKEITSAYRRGDLRVVFSVLQSRRLNICNHYEINFDAMQQRNLETNNMRKVRWSGPPLFADPEPIGDGTKLAIEDEPTGPLTLALPADDTPLPASSDDPSAGRNVALSIASSSNADPIRAAGSRIELARQMMHEPDHTAMLPADSSKSNDTSQHNKIRRTSRNELKS